MNIKEMKKIAEGQMQKFEETGDKGGMITFVFEGVDIINPYKDETGSVEVVPEEYYGEVFLESDWKLIIQKEKLKAATESDEHFLKRLDLVIESALNLSRVWENLDSEFEEQVIESYPFELEFGDIINKMIEWKAKIENNEQEM